MNRRARRRSMRKVLLLGPGEKEYYMALMDVSWVHADG